MFSFLAFRGAMAGIIAGLASGFLGVSPGGILVPVISMLLPYSQHVVQGISLVAQAPPTSIAGLAAYSRKGQRAKFSSALFVSSGFVAGGPVGAFFANLCSERALRWMFVGYLLILTVLAFRRTGSRRINESGPPIVDQGSFASFFLIGIVAGVSSGLLGIGGGLAVIALSVVLLHQKQHEAQVISLTVSAFPLTLPAAWIYVRQGFQLPWIVIGWLIAGLVLGSWIGGLCANRLSEKRLKTGFVALLVAMATYMAFVASRS